MQQQLSLLAEASTPITVAATRAVLIYGARAPEVPRHQAAVQLPGVRPATLARMLALAEDALRYNQAPTATLNLADRRGAGSNGPIGTGNLHADSNGIEAHDTGERAAWPQLLRALRAQREAEPHIAQARDLAQAYRYLHYYAHAYGTPADAPPRLLAAIRDEIANLGGNPDTVPLAA
jgi:hypothetical protein